MRYQLSQEALGKYRNGGNYFIVCKKKKKKRRIIKVPIGVFIIVIDGAEFVIQTPHDRREGSTKRESERRTGVGARAPRRARYCF